MWESLVRAGGWSLRQGLCDTALRAEFLLWKTSVFGGQGLQRIGRGPPCCQGYFLHLKPTDGRCEPIYQSLSRPHLDVFDQPMAPMAQASLHVKLAVPVSEPCGLVRVRTKEDILELSLSRAGPVRPCGRPPCPRPRALAWKLGSSTLEIICQNIACAQAYFENLRFHQLLKGSHDPKRVRTAAPGEGGGGGDGVT